MGAIFMPRYLAVLFLAIIFYPLAQSGVHAQSWVPKIRNERGDTIAYTYPPSSSSYVPNELIIKFRRGALDLGYLCYICPDPQAELKDKGGRNLNSAGPDAQCRSIVMDQRFPVDSGVLASSAFVQAVKSFGGTTLRRMTPANPCRDTLSQTRRGDTLIIDHHNWLVLHLNNDTSVINAAFWLTTLFQDQIEIAEPNYYTRPLRTPNDYYYSNSPNQLSLTMIGMPLAWNYEVGISSVDVGIIDDGVDYLHCDLGGELGPKVKGGDKLCAQR